MLNSSQTFQKYFVPPPSLLNWWQQNFYLFRPYFHMSLLDSVQFQLLFTMVDLKKEISGVHTEKNISTIEIKLNLFKSQKLSIKYLFRLLQLSKRQQEMSIDEDVESSQACPSMSYLFPGNTNYAKDIRSPLANFVPTRTKTSNLVRKLHASDFQSNNDDHLNLVKNMGINIISLPDGRVQLLHTLSNVSSQWYFVTIIVLTYCEKKLFQCEEKN